MSQWGTEMRWGCASGGCPQGPRDPSACRQGLDFLHVPGCTGAISLSSTGISHLPGAGASMRKRKAIERGRFILTASASGSFTFSLSGSAPLQTRTGTQSPTLAGGCFPSHWSIPSARNSQLQEDTLPGRQAPCAQDASSMSSPLSLEGEHRADGHAPAATLQSHTHKAPPLTGVQWELDQNNIPAVVQQDLQMFLSSSWRGCMDRSPHGMERQSSCQNDVAFWG